MMDNINLIDKDDKSVGLTGRVHTTLLRLKEETFPKIKKVYANFRKELKNSSESNISESNVVDSTVTLENNVNSVSSIIDRIKDKLDILPAEDKLPEGKVQPIKLSVSMLDGTKKCRDFAYSDSDKVVNDEASDYGFSDFASTDFAISAMPRKKKEESEDTSKSVITSDDIKDVIEEKFAEINDNKEEKEVVEEKVSSEIDTPVENVIDRSEIEEEITPQEEKDYSVDEVINEVKEPVEEVDERIHVYDSMPEEDVEKARENIEYNEYEEKYAGNVNAEDSNIRDEVIVTPERETAEEKVADYTFVEDTPESVHFDYSEATVGDIKQAVNIDASPEGLEAMKNRILKLKEEQTKSKADLDEARKAQSEEARKAEEARKLTEEAEKEYEVYYSKFADYEAAVKEDIDFNNNAIASANEEAESNRKFIKEQEEKRQNYKKEIDEMLSIMSPEAINVKMGR